MSAHDKGDEVYLTVPLNTLLRRPDELGHLSVRLQRGANLHRQDGRSFFLDVINDGRNVLYARLAAQEGVMLSLYLLRVAGRAPRFEVGGRVADAWQTKLAMRLYGRGGGTTAHGTVWVEDDAIWIGVEIDGFPVASARLNEEQTASLAQLADAMDEVF